MTVMYASMINQVAKQQIDQSQARQQMNLLQKSKFLLEGVKNKLFKPKEQMPHDRSKFGVIVGGQDIFTNEGQKGKYCTL